MTAKKKRKRSDLAKVNKEIKRTKARLKKLDHMIKAVRLLNNGGHG